MNGPEGEEEEEEEGGWVAQLCFVKPLCFSPMSEIVALAWGLFQFSNTTTDVRVSTDVKTIGPNSVYVSGHRRDFK